MNNIVTDIIKNESPVLRVQASGRCAEVVVDTGHMLRSGKTWLAFARVPCTNVYTAKILSENLSRRIEDAVAEARREAYYQGYNAARMGRSPCPQFDGVL
jgi:hypothetical protein